MAFYMLVVMIGCSTDLDRDAYVKWVRDYGNGLHKQEVYGEYIYDVQYQPAEYVLLQRNYEKLNPKDVSAALKDIGKVQYINLTISHNSKTDVVKAGTHDIAEFQRKDYYFSYQLQEDITLEENGQILPCVLYHYEKPATKDGGRTFVLGFEKTNTDVSECKLVIKSDILNSLPVKIKISKTDIPKVRL
jgi:hypothetical protein